MLFEFFLAFDLRNLRNLRMNSSSRIASKRGGSNATRSEGGRRYTMTENVEAFDLHGPYRDLPTPFQAMDPADEVGWLAVADWLEEHDQPDRAELVRLTHASGDEERI